MPDYSENTPASSGDDSTDFEDIEESIIEDTAPEPAFDPVTPPPDADSSNNNYVATPPLDTRPLLEFIANGGLPTVCGFCTTDVSTFDLGTMTQHMNGHLAHLNDKKAESWEESRQVRLAQYTSLSGTLQAYVDVDGTADHPERTACRMVLEMYLDHHSRQTDERESKRPDIVYEEGFPNKLELADGVDNLADHGTRADASADVHGSNTISATPKAEGTGTTGQSNLAGGKSAAVDEDVDFEEPGAEKASKGYHNVMEGIEE
ncbi:hypothetical protein QBC46DRAFT_449899 [Diplogelasinospora grovesii]|uniref:Uncharacterized protein n=1 Tax=Diplogelasinospora grovesii TaxID=303347 RepID=A0AAN6S4A7_9PEZI|nr:hypothetical protein QBC46DRAFT_449899 [Diplogelasinospora grovesii]